jgi:hypothetical protein
MAKNVMLKMRASEDIGTILRIVRRVPNYTIVLAECWSNGETQIAHRRRQHKTVAQRSFLIESPWEAVEIAVLK